MMTVGERNEQRLDRSPEVMLRIASYAQRSALQRPACDASCRDDLGIPRIVGCAGWEEDLGEGNLAGSELKVLPASDDSWE